MWSSLGRMVAVETRSVTSSSGVQAIGDGFVRADHAKVPRLEVELHHVAQQAAHHARGFRIHRPGLRNRHGVIAEIRQHQVLQQQAAIGVRVGAHAPRARRRQRADLLHRFAVAVEQLFRAVALHPGFQNADVLRLLGQLRQRHLVRAEGAFDLHAIHHLRPGPALGAAQYDHGPGAALAEAARAGFALDLADALHHAVERGGHELVHHVRIVALHEMRLVAVAFEQLHQLVVRPCAPAPWGRRSCIRSDAGWE